MPTRNHYIQKHREMWNWISHQTYARRKCMTKTDYANEIDDSINHIQNSCWLCECLAQTDEINCNKCPLIWDETDSEINAVCAHSANGMDGLYNLWKTACEHENYRDAADFAMRIANLPERPQKCQRLGMYEYGDVIIRHGECNDVLLNNCTDRIALVYEILGEPVGSIYEADVYQATDVDFDIADIRTIEGWKAVLRTGLLKETHDHKQILQWLEKQNPNIPTDVLEYVRKIEDKV